MVGFNNLKELVDAELEGRTRFYTWRKSPSQVTTAGIWFDLALSPGNPVPKFWFDATPLIAKQIAQSTDGGLYHGANVSPYTKYLRTTMAMTATSTALPMSLILCDYLLYYPTIDESTTDEQLMDNSTTLSRYTDGDGVQMIAVNLAGAVGGVTFTVKYTNQDGTEGRVTPPIRINAYTAIGNIVSADGAAVDTAAPFLPLQDGDTGVRKVESVTMITADVGLFAIILVKPLMQTQIRGIDAPVERDYFLETGLNLIEIKDDAYLNWLCQPNGALNATAIFGYIKTTYN